ncbi:hypothetical protein Bbelb_126780 [Branchiostoma belcheri]|nr:hypothetical protein Bbelb_126780 [Branchiostoma belcheri]
MKSVLIRHLAARLLTPNTCSDPGKFLIGTQWAERVSLTKMSAGRNTGYTQVERPKKGLRAGGSLDTAFFSRPSYNQPPIEVPFGQTFPPGSSINIAAKHTGCKHHAATKFATNPVLYRLDPDIFPSPFVFELFPLRTLSFKMDGGEHKEGSRL